MILTHRDCEGVWKRVESDDDRAVAKSVEDLSAAGTDDPASLQEKDAKAAGGAPYP
jgi:hypothetical protein